jgi:hypothetical protein
MYASRQMNLTFQRSIVRDAKQLGIIQAACRVPYYIPCTIMAVPCSLHQHLNYASSHPLVQVPSTASLITMERELVLVPPLSVIQKS